MLLLPSMFVSLFVPLFLCFVCLFCLFGFVCLSGSLFLCLLGCLFLVYGFVLFPRFPKENFKSQLEASGSFWEASGNLLLGTSGKSLEASRSLWKLLGASSKPLEALGSSWEAFGSFWEAARRLWEAFGSF